MPRKIQGLAVTTKLFIWEGSEAGRSMEKQTVNTHGQLVDLKETKDMYRCVMALAKSSQDIDLKNTIGNYVCTLAPRTLLQIDSVLHVLINKNSYPAWKDLEIDY